MKEYKFVILNHKLNWTREKDVMDAEEMVNKYIHEGWELQQIITPNDGVASMVGVFYKEF